MTRIGIDIDGTIYNFRDKLRDYIHETTGRPLEEMSIEANTWLFFDDQWGYSIEEYLAFIDQGVHDKEIFWRGEVYDNALWGVSELYRSGFEIVFITARGYHGLVDQCKMATEYWLNSHGFPYHELIIDSDKTKYDLDILIDDAPEHFFLRSQAGLDTLIYDQSWNRDLHDSPRAIGWIEVVDFVKEKFSTNVGN
jgi:uncharacterized HAD superfamily protein